MYLSLWLLILSQALTAVARTSSHRKRQTPSSQFVTVNNGQFEVNGSAFNFIGTNAYWLSALNTEQDIADTLSNISASGIRVVRTWAFNDVPTIPVNGTWFQLIANGTTTVNNGTNGLQKLDTVIKLAEKFGIYLLPSLTNNWNPLPLLDNLTNGVSTLDRRDVTAGTNNTLPRNFLSNDYGGMDAYVRGFGGKHHDDFYTNTTIIEAFEGYTTAVVSRYVQSPAILGWELANDPRCNSSINASPTCTTTTITQWHSIIAQHIKSIDPNHLVTSGNQGFFCTDCPKLFPLQAPPPQPSPAPGRRRAVPRPLTKARLLRERTDARKKTRNLKRLSGEATEGRGISIRGRWTATPTRRQDESGVGAAFDGSQGVDSEDILNIPQIGFGSFQLFPDQNQYEPNDPNLPPFNNTVNAGLEWIQRHAESSAIFGKPISLTGFGLVTQSNAPFFVPFNETVAPFGPDGANSTITSSGLPYGVTDQQRDDAYSQWIQTGIVSGLQGIIQYQWAESNLTTSPGTTISPVTTGTSESPNQEGPSVSPNDGYSIAGVGQDSAEATISNAVQQIGSLSP